ncbi:hypothetical protein [Massilia sp. TWP1-3-3]|uniref:hypothetical protein n=1 Tax=Massilia sp. TWP1-3-3 TaxID=2804573 RepID=UPI003CE7DE1E
MATAPKPPGRKIGRSTTSPSSKGKHLRLEDPLDKGYLCGKMCACNLGTAIVSKTGAILRQRCASARVWFDEEINHLVWRYKAEVGFSMKANPPAPLMSRKQPNRPSRFPLGEAIGQGILKKGLEGKIQKGLLRIPDCLVLKITGPELAAMRASGAIDWKKLIPIKHNIETVVEMKFEGDNLTVQQANAYRRIAGPKKFRLLEMSDCDCGGKKREQPATEPVRVPVTTPLLFLPTGPKGPLDGKPIAFPVPQPVRPTYGPVVPASESVPMSNALKTAVVVGGIIIIGVIVIAAAPEIAIGAAVVEVGGALLAGGRLAYGLIALAVASSSASLAAAPSKKGK